MTLTDTCPVGWDDTPVDRLKTEGWWVDTFIKDRKRYYRCTSIEGEVREFTCTSDYLWWRYGMEGE